MLILLIQLLVLLLSDLPDPICDEGHDVVRDRNVLLCSIYLPDNLLIL